MSTQRADEPGPASAPGEPQHEPSEEELRAAYEAELSRITSTDVMLQAAVSLLNIASYRMSPRQPPAGSQASGAIERDLEQVRDAIDGVRALLAILERRASKELGPLRDALSQLQIAYAREAQADVGSGSGQQHGGEAGAAAGQGARQGGPADEKDSPSADQAGHSPGPAEASGRLWVPGR